MLGRITSVSGVRNMTCYPLNTPTRTQSAKAWTDKTSYTCIKSLKEMERSIYKPRHAIIRANNSAYVLHYATVRMREFANHLMQTCDHVII